MKRFYILMLTACCSRAIHLQAQTPFNTIDSSDINNINASVLVHGDMWWNGDGSHAQSKCFFPKGSQKTIAFTSSLWMSGYDGGGQLHVAAQTYRQDGNDYWPGPIDATTKDLSYAISKDWAYIWKVNRTDILSFVALITHTTANTPNSILTWPGRGNIYAKGNAGASLTISSEMAPFADLNGNGIYEPLAGEYPAIKGDQALWWVFSDNGPTHSTTSGRPLTVEVHAMAYAYKHGTIIDNVIYYDYSFLNKSDVDYTNFRSGIWTDIEIGYPFDDFIGFDSSHRMGICYNGSNDDGGSAGNPANSYGTNPPMVGISVISQPGDAYPAFTPAGSFTYYNNDFSIIGNPVVDTEYNNYMRSKLKNGNPLSSIMTRPDRYIYNGDPSIPGQWSECGDNDNPADRRFIITTNDFTLKANSSERFVMALIVVDSAGACPGANFNKIKKAADTAWDAYHHPLYPNAITDITEADIQPLIYPNPAHRQLIIDNIPERSNEESIVVSNMLGQKMNAGLSRTNNKYTIDISQLSNGVYCLTYSNGTIKKVMRFVRE